MKTAIEIRNGMAQCYGSQSLIEHFTGMLFTEGVNFVRLSADAFWLVDVIASHQHKLKGELFQVWAFKCNIELKLGTVTCSDGNGNELVKQEIEYTDFPLDTIEFFCELGGTGTCAEDWVPAMVLMLPSER